MIIAVTGGRDHELTLEESVWLVRMLERHDCTIFRHGACTGVDAEAARIAACVRQACELRITVMRSSGEVIDHLPF